MAEERLIRPDYIFEVSWEVCNKVGGIHTVLTTKALSLVNEWEDKLIMIGPDVWKGTGEHPEFEEDKELFRSWRPHAEARGLKVRVGRWKITGNPIVILVDFTTLFQKRDEVFTELWLRYRVDSLTGQWDYIEPALFGYAAGRVIECFYHHFLTYSDKVVAQFHEWLTGAGLLYLEAHIPQVATVFTTHATVVGRSIAGNELPLYGNFESYNGEQEARRFNVLAKHSLEKTTAAHADCFTTVSGIAAKECAKLLEKPPDVITPNGFEDTFVPDPFLAKEKRITARGKLIKVAAALTGRKLTDDSLLVLKSGRYEFRNKGIDLFIDAMAALNRSQELKKNIIAFIFVPGPHTGPRKRLAERLAGTTDYPNHDLWLTHHLQGIESDPVINRIRSRELTNKDPGKVTIIFAPVYMDGNDGIFNLTYYDLLTGFDLSVFPSYYEPWGYTPLESLAFQVPTVTTDLTGFGMFVKDSNKGISVIHRTEDNAQEVTDKIAAIVKDYAGKNKNEIRESREAAAALSKKALWKNLIIHYKEAYHAALLKTKERESRFVVEPKVELPHDLCLTTAHSKGNLPKWKKIYVQSELPEKLKPLQELSKNLWWTWNRDAEDLFQSIDKELWKVTKGNPVVMLYSLSFAQLTELEKDEQFLSRMSAVHKRFTQYLSQRQEKKSPSVAYFCMEYGLDVNLKIYSGGLGILAGDYLKQASDDGANIIGVGLLYRNGYFRQRITAHGEQVEEEDKQSFTHLPMQPVRNADGDWVKVTIAFPGRTLHAKAWKVSVGTTPLYLLDADIAENTKEDRAITSQLYAGGIENRLKQEFLLGIGGVRLLNLLGIFPDIYHCNEGHAAFLGLERLYRITFEENMSFDEALEVVRASTVFTTHTPVEAGHDHFSEEILRTYLAHYASILNINWSQLTGLGKADATNATELFSMSYLAARFSQAVNGVSKLHGKVTRRMFSKLWTGYIPSELHIGSVTNGVHLPTWIAAEWLNLFREIKVPLEKHEPEKWKEIFNAPSERIWEIHKVLKRKLIEHLNEKLAHDLESANQPSEKIEKHRKALSEDALLIGFVRRMVPYKRPELLFRDMNALAEIINDSSKPVVFLFAGKAHPNDLLGKEIIKSLVKRTATPELEGKVLFLENYDMHLAKYLVSGVDVWLNNPVPGMEASGTSGMKAAINGVLNFSMADGWWAEVTNSSAGCTISRKTNQRLNHRDDEADADSMYDWLKSAIIPMYFMRDAKGCPMEWVEKMKHSIAAAGSAFSAARMLGEYHRDYYLKLFERKKMLTENSFEKAKALAAWKKKMMRAWDRLDVKKMDLYDPAKKEFPLGTELSASVRVALGELSVNDIGLEIVFVGKRGRGDDDEGEIILSKELQPSAVQDGEALYTSSLPMIQSGVFEYGFRLFAKNPLMPHRQDFSLVKWV